MKKILKLVLLGVVLLAADLLTKHVFYGLGYCSDCLFVAKVFNTGISRGINLPEIVTFIVSALAIALFVWMYMKKQFTRWMMALIMAGTLGNLYDRLMFDGVRDFISVGNFPVFNLADVWLNIGVLLFVIWEVRLAKKK